MEKQIAVKLQNLKKHFNGVRAVDDLSIEIEKGKITGIVGPNGSGKTTLTNMLSGFIESDGGIIGINGFKSDKIKPYNAPTFGITRTFQDVRLFEQMTVLDNILVVLTERGILSSLFEKHSDFHLGKAKEVLQRVELWEKKNELAHNLSYGQRKLLEIARILAMAHSTSSGQANIILFDEPFAGLFPKMREVVVSVIKELKQQGKTVVLIEHNMKLIRELCDHLFVLDSGKLLAEGKPDEILGKKEVVEAYLGE